MMEVIQQQCIKSVREADAERYISYLDNLNQQ